MPAEVPGKVVPRQGHGLDGTTDSLAMGRAQQVGRYLDPNGPQQITWVHNHSLVRGWKVILNVYDILPKRANSCLTLVGLGGAYHSALEVGGREYAFGGHFSDSLGIMGLQRPLFRLRQEAAEAVQAGEDDEAGSAAAALAWMPTLRSRVVVGWWMGPVRDFEELMRDMQDKGWTGPSYRLLTRNCNHFVVDLCALLLASPRFKPAPGKGSLDRMLPRRLTALTSFAAACCSCGPCCCVRKLNAPMPLAPYLLNVFQGQPRSIAEDWGWCHRRRRRSGEQPAVAPPLRIHATAGGGGGGRTVIPTLVVTASHGPRTLGGQAGSTASTGDGGGGEGRGDGEDSVDGLGNSVGGLGKGRCVGRGTAGGVAGVVGVAEELVVEQVDGVGGVEGACGLAAVAAAAPHVQHMVRGGLQAGREGAHGARGGGIEGASDMQREEQAGQVTCASLPGEPLGSDGDGSLGKAAQRSADGPAGGLGRSEGSGGGMGAGTEVEAEEGADAEWGQGRRIQEWLAVGAGPAGGGGIGSSRRSLAVEVHGSSRGDGRGAGGGVAGGVQDGTTPAQQRVGTAAVVDGLGAQLVGRSRRSRELQQQQQQQLALPPAAASVDVLSPPRPLATGAGPAVSAASRPGSAVLPQPPILRGLAGSRSGRRVFPDPTAAPAVSWDGGGSSATGGAGGAVGTAGGAVGLGGVPSVETSGEASVWVGATRASVSSGRLSAGGGPQQHLHYAQQSSASRHSLDAGSTRGPRNDFPQQHQQQHHHQDHGPPDAALPPRASTSLARGRPPKMHHLPPGPNRPATSLAPLPPPPNAARAPASSSMPPVAREAPYAPLHAFQTVEGSDKEAVHNGAKAGQQDEGVVRGGAGEVLGCRSSQTTPEPFSRPEPYSAGPSAGRHVGLHSQP